MSYYPELGSTGLFFNPGPHAIYLAISIPWVVVYTIKKFAGKRYVQGLLGVVLLGVGTFLIAVLMSRSAWIGLFCGITLPLIVFFGNTNRIGVLKKITLFTLGCTFFYCIM